MKIAVDAMGGDYAPKVVIEGAVAASKEYGCRIALVGIRERIEEELQKIGGCPEAIEIVHASEIIQMNEPAALSIRKKRDSSIIRALELIKQQKADAFFSAGNTGAGVCAATLGLGMLSEVERPGIAIIMPTVKKTPTLIIDAGANIDAKPTHLLQYAAMAQAYYRHIFNCDNPSVGLLNIGEEEAKGTDFVKETYRLLESSHLNFQGNVEGKDVFKGKTEIVICDGFVGNVTLKVSEGVAEAFGVLLKRELTSSLMAKIGSLFVYPALRRFKKNFDYSEYGGAPLLGVNGIVIIGHGRSSAKAIKNAIRVAIKEVENNVNQKMLESVRKLTYNV
ncbi:MAG: phosphate acyltransferase [Omnitrophica WOR_2 bacterium GWF2_43_52]|nr:MAG: phosphate acyltransferase [Omnitrophica WOR_2 bacterium GWC2_44_8]OGX21393.1 MAG: phosphate acyltransferase [Omnitrophica WOR_2 bacterium GWF2_43_52]OGX54299.1 MAG: phosphate acyltransferase [Omnitrophica WOR_2 bacterium RIFOXYC2_FULL_43_9]HAH21980.1 phosphate acyltransferase PlsX [Candidatus Omnitrophota bacterium]HBG62657.1 phosphate acyltransferase PlsX [Candidatus Omnitrophota bacterium]